MPNPRYLTPNPQGRIGLIDSGVGGLSVLGHIQKMLPAEDLLYIADQAHVPYGRRPIGEVRLLCQGLSSALIKQGVKIIVVACNTASAAALDHLRNAFTDISIVGMEPAIKPGAYETNSGKIGVLATPGTFDSGRYARLITRFAGDVELYENPCQGLVELIEKGQTDGRPARRILDGAIKPMIEAGVDTLVLGCTHYPFVLPLINQITGPDVRIVDPAPAVAQQVRRVLEAGELLSQWDRAGQVQTYTTAAFEPFAIAVKKLLGYGLPTATASWSDGYALSFEELR